MPELKITAAELLDAHRKNEDRYAQLAGDPRAHLSPHAIADRAVLEALRRIQAQAGATT